MFNGWLDAELYVRYLRRLIQRRKLLESILAVATGFTASAAFVNVVADGNGWLGITLSLIAALTGAVNAVISPKSPVADWASLAAQWSRRSRKWNELWLGVRTGETIDLAKLNATLNDDVPIEEKTSTFPQKKRLLSKIQDEVVESLGLKP